MKLSEAMRIGEKFTKKREKGYLSVLDFDRVILADALGCAFLAVCDVSILDDNLHYPNISEILWQQFPELKTPILLDASYKYAHLGDQHSLKREIEIKNDYEGKSVLEIADWLEELGY